MACILGIVLIPAGISLDYISYPDQLSTLAMIRLISAGLIAIIYALHFWDTTAAHVRYLTMAGLLVAVAEGGNVSCWDISGGQMCWHRAEVTATDFLTFTPSGTLLQSGTSGHPPTLLSVDDGTPVLGLTLNRKR